MRHIEISRGNCHARMDGAYADPCRFGRQIGVGEFDRDPMQIHVVAQEGEMTLPFPEYSASPSR